MKRPQKGFTNADTNTRVAWIKKYSGLDFSNSLTDSPDNLKGIIEQHIGYHTIPMAIASPLVLHGEFAKGTFLLPVCTIEGTLVYSLTRGMMAAADSGGIIIRHLGQRLSRAPVFLFSSIVEVKPFIDFIDKHYEQIKKVSESTTRYGKLIEIKKIPNGPMVILEFIYTTGDAAGQNMVTIATHAGCKYIQSRINNGRFFLESGLNCDKKLSRRTMSVGRGHSLLVETVISKQILRRLFHIDVQEAVEFFQLGSAVSQIAGTLGNQLHIANGLAAIYLAMGQDVACVAENSLGNIKISEGPEKGSAVFTMLLPSLTIGTVGGGIRLPSQQRNLELIGCHEGTNSSKKLAEIIGGAVLCLEMSLFSAIVSDTFAEAHQLYGRING